MAYERIKCPRCEKDFGQEVRFYGHLVSDHDIVDPLQLYLEVFLDKIHPHCLCSSDCTSRLPWSGWKKGFISKYARGHNAKLDSVYLDKSRQVEFAQKRKSGYSSGQYNIWNKGLTKETSEKISNISESISSTLKEGYSSGRIVDWRKEDPGKSIAAARKISETRKIKFDCGELKSWNDGLTKHDHPSLMIASKKISEYRKNCTDPRRYDLRELIEIIEPILKENELELITPLDEYKNKYQRLTFSCKTCCSTMEKNLMMLKSCPRCFSCQPKGSYAQVEIARFIQSLDVEVISNDRSTIGPKELDISVPAHKFAIEYNGLYWHSVAVLPDPEYHDQKLKSCLDKGINLFSVYEDEWRDKKAIVEGMIRHRLNRPIAKWHARKLEIVELDRKSSKLFFDNNHLEGHVNSEMTLALRDPSSGIILAAMSLRKPFHKKYSQLLEVARCCVLSGHSVRGWLGKLTSKAKEHALKSGRTGLMTYVDGRVGAGSGYVSAGWKLTSTTSPRFWWTDFKNRFNRFKYRADSKNKLTQEQVAKNAGVTMIWGCPNSLYFFI